MATGEKGYRHWFRQARSNRRQVLRGGAVSAAGLTAAALLAGCGPQQSSTTGTQNSAGNVQPKRGGTLVVVPGTSGDAWLTGFDPHIRNGSPTGPMGLFYQRLIRYDVKDIAKLEPEIAQRWEQPSTTEYLFKLSPGIKWHNKPPVNGRSLTAEDVVYSLERVRTNDPQFIVRSLIASVDKIEAVDSGTVRLTTREPDATLLSSLGDLSILILAREVIEKFGTGKLTTAESAVGTGPFMLTSHDDSAGYAVRNPDYWKPGLPYFDAVRAPYLRDRASRWSAFVTGELDLDLVPGSEAKQFVAEQGSKYQIEYFQDVAAYNHWVNAAKPPFSDARVYKALRLLIDHKEALSGWADVWFGAGELTTHLPGALKSWEFTDEELQKFLEWKNPKDDAVRAALGMLSAAGFTRDNPLKFVEDTIESDYTQASAQLAQDQWRRLSQGVLQPELKVFENVAQISRMSRGEFDTAGPSVRGGYIDPDPVFQQIYRSNAANNFGKWSDRRADEMIDKQRTIFDLRERRALVKELLGHLVENAPYSVFAARKGPWAAKPKVRGWAPGQLRDPWYQYEHVWFDA